MKTDANRIVPVLASLVFALALPGRADEQGNPGSTPERGKLSSSDQKFLTEAARGSMKEVKLGEIARNQASNSAVKDFAERMVTDHGKANEDLRNLASQKGFELPTDISDEAQRDIDRLSKLSGNEFDREYTDAMMEDHQQDLKTFRDAAERADDSDVKAFASRTAGVIEQHMDTVKQLQAQHKSDSDSSGGQNSGGDKDSSRDRKNTHERDTMRENDSRDDDSGRDKGRRERTVTKEKRRTSEN